MCWNVDRNNFENKKSSVFVVPNKLSRACVGGGKILKRIVIVIFWVLLLAFSSAFLTSSTIRKKTEQVWEKCKSVFFFNRITEENAKQNEKEKLVFVFASILGIYVCNCVLNCIYQTKRSSNQERERKFRLVRFLGKYWDTR